ncbi:MAG: bifunctional diaminohydroxyphosphoribosylaminopyrimidine deaminase/5-amino-6-(5-phosphoribosylamino)uracil reductase RibD [Candidatus Malihini olakiniferum]
MEPQDEFWMARALELARLWRFNNSPNPNVGCVIVRDGEMVGEGYHLRAGEPHAEVHALLMAGERARGATAYVTLEPCSHHGRTPPCADALIASGVARVVAAMQDPNPQVAGCGLHHLQQAGIAVSHGLMMQDAEQVNLGFLKRMRTGIPYVRLKVASSLDGRTAMASGESKWITSPEARQDVQRFRAQSSAILSSSATVLADDPLLTVRWDALDSDTQQQLPDTHLSQPIRVIVDSHGRVTPQHQLIHQQGQTWLARSTQPNNDTTWPESVTHLTLPAHRGGVDLVALMMTLGKRQINSVWVEAGATLAGALLNAGVVDELIVYMALKLLGQDARALCVLPGLMQLAQAPSFTLTEVRQIGPDLRLHLIPQS